MIKQVIVSWFSILKGPVKSNTKLYIVFYCINWHSNSNDNYIQKLDWIINYVFRYVFTIGHGQYCSGVYFSSIHIPIDNPSRRVIVLKTNFW